MGHFFFRLGGDGLMGLYADVGHGISGYWGQRALLGETFFIANLEFLNTVLADVFGGSIGIPGVTSFSKTGQSVGAGVRLRAFADFTKERGAHGFGLGLGAVGLFTESPLGAPFVVLGHLTGSASWPFVEVNLYATLAIWASAPDARRALQNGSFGVNLGLRDPLAPLFELLGRLSK